jgi:hypothetical protein
MRGCGGARLAAHAAPRLLVGADQDERTYDTQTALVDVSSMQVVWDFASKSEGNWKLSGTPAAVRASSDRRRSWK